MKGLKTKSTREHSLKAFFIKELSPSIIQSENNGEFIGEIEQRFCKEPGVGNVHVRLHHRHQKVRDKILKNWSSDLCQGFHKSCSEFSKLMSGLCYSQLLNTYQIYKNYKPSRHDSLWVESIHNGCLQEYKFSSEDFVNFEITWQEHCDKCKLAELTEAFFKFLLGPLYYPQLGSILYFLDSP